MKAFPTSIDNGHSRNQDGMDLRDYFAAKAMHAMLINNPVACKTLNYDEDKETCALAAGCISDGAYDIADAMMEARK